jgi:hypothetical protein
MHYRKYSTDDLVDALLALEALQRIVHQPMSEDTDKWDCLCGLEAEHAAMQLELTRRAMPAERILIPVEAA